MLNFICLVSFVIFLYCLVCHLKIKNVLSKSSVLLLQYITHVESWTDTPKRAVEMNARRLLLRYDLRGGLEYHPVEGGCKGLSPENVLKLFMTI